MSANTFGSRFRLTTFGESHGPGFGAVIDGCPAGVRFDDGLLALELERRRPGNHGGPNDGLVSRRLEPDRAEVLSGVHRGRTLGTPIAILVRNRDARPADYAALGDRPGRADDLWRRKFGRSDPRGGGRASGRETVSRVLGGAVAQMFLRQTRPSLRVTAFAGQLGSLALSSAERARFAPLARKPRAADVFPGRFPSTTRSGEVRALLRKGLERGRSYGGVAEVWVDGAPALLGQPVFAKLKADLAAAVMGVGGCIGVELGAGFSCAAAEGAEFHVASDPLGRRYGGIRGGLSTGGRIAFAAAFKPPATFGSAARRGRHDPCIVLRVIPVLEAMTWLVLADHVLWARSDRA